jgi:hypothetical protein
MAKIRLYDGDLMVVLVRIALPGILLKTKTVQATAYKVEKEQSVMF